MKVLIHIGGAQNGFNTPCSGEMRYAMNLAEMLASYGHQVYCWGGGNHMHEPPQWGSQVPIENIYFIMLREVEGQEFDLVLNCPRIFERPDCMQRSSLELPVKTKLKVFTSFSWDKSSEETYLNFFKDPGSNNCIVATPYKLPNTKENIVPHYFIPFPYFKEYAPLDIESRNQITWACKDVYSDEWQVEKEFHFLGKRVLEAIRNIANNHNLTLNFISAYTLKSDRAKRYEIPEIIDRITNKNLVDTTVPMETMHKYLSSSRFSIILPGYAGSAFNSVADGCPTIFYESSDDFTKILGKPKVMKRGFTTEQTLNFLDQFLDNSKFEQFIDKQRKRVDQFSYKNSYKQLMKVIESAQCK